MYVKKCALSSDVINSTFECFAKLIENGMLNLVETFIGVTLNVETHFVG